MDASTKYFGEISYTQEDILHIPSGLFGFEKSTKYLLVHFTENDNTLLCLQSLEDADLAFVLTSPFSILPEYHPLLSSDDMTALNLSEDSEVTFYAICVVHDKLEDSTINLRCPIVINPATRYARQVILEDASLSFKHPLKKESKMGKEESHC